MINKVKRPKLKCDKVKVDGKTVKVYRSSGCPFRDMGLERPKHLRKVKSKA